MQGRPRKNPKKRPRMIRRLASRALKGKTDNGFVQLIRYGLVSVVALVVDFGGMVLLVELLSVHYLVAATVSFTAGLIVNYVLSRLWVFNESRYRSKAGEFIAFSLIGIVGLLLNNGIIWLSVEHVGMHYAVSKVIATGVVFFWNFGLRKIIVFKQIKKEEVL